MDYKVTDLSEDKIPKPRGEVCFKGPCTFKGYYKDQEETDRILCEDGYVRTGDIAEIQTNGSIKILDRVKQIFKLSHGEYICPNRLESIFTES
jgi:long-chain acyl-CoA synthetase